MPSHKTSQSEDTVTAMPGALDYIRGHYGVPATIGGRVLFEGRPGTICGTTGHYLRIKLDDERVPSTFHATWHLEYVDG